VSRPLEVGAPAPPIDLPAAAGRVESRQSAGSPLVVEFLRGTW
jgi:hypothetical protein